MTGWPFGPLGRVRGQRTGREPFAPPPPLSLEFRLARIERELAAARHALERQATLIEALTALVTSRLDALEPPPAATGASPLASPRRPRGLGKGLGALIPVEPENVARRPAHTGFVLPAAAAHTPLLVRAKGLHQHAPLGFVSS